MDSARLPFRAFCLVLIVLSCVAAASPATGQVPSPVRLAVFVSHSGTDDLGLSFSNSVKGALRRSSTLAVGTTVDEADVVLAISTLNPNPAKPGVVTTAGWTVLVPGDVKAYIGSGLLLCDQERLDKASDEVTARVEALLKARAPGLAGSIDRKRYEAEWADAVDDVAETLPEDSCGVKSRAAFREQLDTYLRLSAATNQRLDVREVIKSVAANFSTDEEFARKIQAQAAKLAQCQADLAALRKK
jgi:hypothetical protein